MCGTVYGDMHLKRSPGINRKIRILYPDPGFLSSTTWPSMPKKQHNGLIIELTQLWLCLTNPPNRQVQTDGNPSDQSYRGRHSERLSHYPEK